MNRKPRGRVDEPMKLDQRKQESVEKQTKSS